MEHSETSHRWQRLRGLFDATLHLPPDERDSVLRDACGADIALRREIEALLESYRQSGSFLDDPACLAVEDLLPRELEGRRIGPYDIGPRIGAGGMGEVYRAIDTRLNRVVAIKVRRDGILDALNAGDQLGREAKAISALNHPNICLLHDVGRHQSFDFLVMEYVDGEPIDVYSDRHGLGVRRRLALLATVCRAVHYAHQNLIVHRDLKPTNILVTADGQPKLLDFGIAKLLNATNTSDTLTSFPLLTPDYASPEQVRGETVTTATDVYSLGVVLYQLLAGRRPFTVRSGSLEDIVHAVCETNPVAPSLAAADPDPSSAAALRSARELKGDLDTIVMKALRKEPDRRYLSAQALADDIDRYLRGQPIAARGDALRYKFSKLVGRHRVAAVMTVLVAVSLIAAMALIVRQSRLAEMQRQRAERRFADVRRLAGSFLFEFHDAIKPLPGSTRARELVAKRALEYLDSLAGESADDPTLRAELARAYKRVGDVQGGYRDANLGSVANALTSYRRALAMQEQLVAGSPADPALQRDLAATLVALGDAQDASQQLTGARDSFQRALEISTKLAASGPASRDARRDLALARHRLAVVQGQLGDPMAAVEGLGLAIAMLEDLAKEDRDVDSRYLLARSYKWLGVWQVRLKNFPANREMVQRAFVVIEALSNSDPVNATFRGELATTGMEVGRAHLRLNDFSSALAAFRNAEGVLVSMVTSDPSNAQAPWLHGLTLNLIGVTLRRMGQPNDAIAAHHHALTLLEGLMRSDSANENYHYNVANTDQLIGDAYVALARRHRGSTPSRDAWIDARAWYSRSAAIFDDLKQRHVLTTSEIPDSKAVQEALELCTRELAKAATHVHGDRH